MSYSVTTTIHCDGCSWWSDGYGQDVASKRPTPTQTRKRLKKQGWYCYQGLDFCPDCVAQRIHIKVMYDLEARRFKDDELV